MIARGVTSSILCHMSEHVARMGRSGRLVIPAAVRAQLGLKPGTELVLRVDDDGLRLQTRTQAVARAQAIVRRRVPSGRKLAHELLEERRREARR